jgi:hypothetical protein
MGNWEDDKVYKFGKWSVHTTKALRSDPVRWYLELHKDSRYWESRGSSLPFRWLAAYAALFSKKASDAND